jgi:putative CocE/NonD family hydrolase
VDFRADSRSGGANRWNYGISSASEPMSLDGGGARRQHYTSAPLAAETEVTGHPVAAVTLSSTHANGDLFVYLEDVAPDGRSRLISEGQLRLNYPHLLPVQQMAGVPQSAIEVRPALPWQGFRRQDYVPDPLAGGRARRYTLDLQPTSWVFKTGHRIRVSLAGADSPSFARHPALDADQDPAPVWTIHCGAGQSQITLPVIP